MHVHVFHQQHYIWGNQVGCQGHLSTPSTTGSTKASIFQPWSHTKNSGYRNKKMIINVSTNCRNKMKLEDLCQGVGTAAAKTSAHDRFKWRAAPVPLHGLCHDDCFSIARFFLSHLPSPPICQLCTWRLIIRRQQLQRWLLHSKNQTVHSMRTCPLVKIHHWSCWSSMEFNHMQWPRVVLFCWWGQWCQHN